MSSLWFFEFGQTDYTTFLLIWILFFYLSWDIWGEALRPTIQSSAGSEFAKLSGGSCRNRFCLQNGGEKALNRCERVTVVQTQDRCFFEKELLYCKLTEGFHRWKLQLHVSFGAVGSRCRCALKNTFLYQVVLHELKKQPFSANQKVFVYRKLYALPSKAFRFRNQNTARSNNFYCPQKPPFYVQKTFYFHKPFLVAI